MKKIPLLITMLIFTIFSNSSTANFVFVPVGTDQPVDFGISQVEKTIDDDKVIIKIKTQGLSVIDDMQGYTATDDLWQIITFPKNKPTRANPVAAGIIEGQVNGWTRGQIDGLFEQTVNSKARLKGEAYCIGQGRNPCTTLAIVMDLKGVLFAPVRPAEFVVNHAGFLDIKIMATFFTGNSTEPPEWKEWRYRGELGLLEAPVQ